MGGMAHSNESGWLLHAYLCNNVGGDIIYSETERLPFLFDFN